MPKISIEEAEEADTWERVRRGSRRTPQTRSRPPRQHQTRAEEFKCLQCRTFVGPTLSGGRHRNHCPLCLYSRHVDLRRPGDRLSRCRALMQPVGTAFRRNGEQVIVHRCLGCGITRHCRVAADDHPLACLRLSPVPLPVAATADHVEHRADPA